MIRPKFLLLLALLAATQTFTSGYRFRCYAFCKDQTSVQDEYTEQRDHCRQYAQLKSEMSSAQGDGKDRKGQLISMFSDCMSRRGWIVPDGKDGKGGSAGNPPLESKTAAAGPAAAGAGAAASGAPAQDPVTQANQQNEQKAFIARASECNFARQNASVSSNAAARAKACDLECEHRLIAAPDAPRPAACPAEMSERLSRGHETE
jgi:hypothetical protein